MKKIIFSFVALVLLCNGCKTDFEVNAPYKEKAIIYGLLNSGNSGEPNLIRISKAFLGEGNAHEMSKIKDSTNYKSGEIEIKLEEFKNNVLTKTYSSETPGANLIKDTIINIPNNGISQEFTSAQNFYTWKGNIQSSNENNIYKYKLTVKNKKSGYTATAETITVGIISYLNPNATTQGIALINNAGDYLPSYIIQFNSSYNGWQYQAFLRLHYSEKDAATGLTTERYYDKLVNDYTVPNSTSTKIELSMKPEDFYASLERDLTASPSLTRIIGKIDVVYTVIPLDYVNFLEISKPSLSVAQTKPEYTNITNGLGFFSVKSTYLLRNLEFNDYTKNELINGKHTKSLNFKDF